MSVTNIVRAVVKPGSDYTVTSPIMKEDKGQILLIEGLDLPEVYEIDFSNERHHGTSVTMIGNADGVLIPTQFIKTGRDVFAFYYYVGDNFGQTEHTFRLPNGYRPDRTDEVPEPEQESLIEQAISALNTAVAQTAQNVQTTTQKASEASESAQSASISERNAADSAETAVNAKNAAEGYAQDANSAKDQAVASATSANESANTATVKASEASTSAITASIKADEARASAASASNDSGIASSAAESANSDAIRAAQAEVVARGYATQAQTSANNASASASQASASATASAQSASDAETARQAATSLVAEAQRYANASEQSAQASATSASQAQGFAQSASASAQSASGYASQAQTSAQTASEKAQDASTSAQTASTKATESAQSASQALTYKTDAESAKTASQTAQGLAEQARDTAVQAKTDAESARDEAQNLVDGISGKVEQIDTNTERIESLEDDIYKPYVIDSASGSIASFPDGADGIPLKSLVVNIDPVQDLHGYDSPWVAGGGKNLLAPTFYDGIGYNVAVGTVLTITEATGVTASGNTYTRTVGNWGGFGMRSPQLASGTYYLMAELASPNMRSSIYVLNSDMSVSRNLGNQGSGTTRSIGTVITLSGDEAYIAFNCLTSSAGNVSISTPMVALSSTATAYAPYENICPISGWTGCEVNATGKNIVDISIFATEYPNYCSYADGVLQVTSNSALYSRGISVDIPQGSVLNWTITNGTSVNARLRIVYEDGTVVSHSSPIPLTVSKRITALRFDWGTGGTFTVSNFQAEFGSMATAYEPYNGTTLPISWQTEAGTVYGGKLDVLRGKLRVTHAYANLSTTGWTLSGANFWRSLTAMSNTNPANVGWCTHYANETRITGDNTIIFGYSPFSVAPRIVVRDSRFTTASDFMAFLAEQETNGTPVMIAYPVANPTEIQLDAHTINSLLGTNNIWADTGDTSVEYRADAKLYIEKLTQPEEDDMVADSAITSGQFFMVGNSLYRALANIASGATITVGTNAQRVSLSDALNLVNA